MSVLIIICDLKKRGQDYNDVHSTIKKYPWARLSESSYAVYTSETPQSVFDKLQPFIDTNDNLCILTLTSPYYGQGPKEVVDWLVEYV